MHVFHEDAFTESGDVSLLHEAALQELGIPAGENQYMVICDICGHDTALVFTRGKHVRIGNTTHAVKYTENAVVGCSFVYVPGNV